MRRRIQIIKMKITFNNLNDMEGCSFALSKTPKLKMMSEKAEISGCGL